MEHKPQYCHRCGTLMRRPHKGPLWCPQCSSQRKRPTAAEILNASQEGLRKGIG